MSVQDNHITHRRFLGNLASRIAENLQPLYGMDNSRLIRVEIGI